MPNFNDILSQLTSTHASPVLKVMRVSGTGAHEDHNQQATNFDSYKKSTARHMIKNDDVSRDSAEVKQILSSSNLEQVEAFLKSAGYCDQGILKTYRMFVNDEPYEDQEQ